MRGGGGGGGERGERGEGRGERGEGSKRVQQTRGGKEIVELLTEMFLSPAPV